MKETKISAKYEDKIASIRDAVREIERMVNISPKDTLQVIIPALLHESDKDRRCVMYNNLLAEVLPDFPYVKELDNHNIMEVSKYLADNYNKVVLNRLDIQMSYTVVLYWRIIRKEKE